LVFSAKRRQAADVLPPPLISGGGSRTTSRQGKSAALRESEDLILNIPVSEEGLPFPVVATPSKKPVTGVKHATAAHGKIGHRTELSSTSTTTAEPIGSTDRGRADSWLQAEITPPPSEQIGQLHQTVPPPPPPPPPSQLQPATAPRPLQLLPFYDQPVPSPGIPHASVRGADIALTGLFLGGEKTYTMEASDDDEWVKDFIGKIVKPEAGDTGGLVPAEQSVRGSLTLVPQPVPVVTAPTPDLPKEQQQQRPTAATRGLMAAEYVWIRKWYTGKCGTGLKREFAWLERLTKRDGTFVLNKRFMYWQERDRLEDETRHSQRSSQGETGQRVTEFELMLSPSALGTLVPSPAFYALVLQQMNKDIEGRYAGQSPKVVEQAKQAALTVVTWQRGNDLTQLILKARNTGVIAQENEAALEAQKKKAIAADGQLWSPNADWFLELTLPDAWERFLAKGKTTLSEAHTSFMGVSERIWREVAADISNRSTSGIISDGERAWVENHLDELKRREEAATSAKQTQKPADAQNKTLRDAEKKEKKMKKERKLAEKREFAARVAETGPHRLVPERKPSPATATIAVTPVQTVPAAIRAVKNPEVSKPLPEPERSRAGSSTSLSRERSAERDITTPEISESMKVPPARSKSRTPPLAATVVFSNVEPTEDELRAGLLGRWPLEMIDGSLKSFNAKNLKDIYDRSEKTTAAKKAALLLLLAKYVKNEDDAQRYRERALLVQRKIRGFTVGEIAEAEKDIEMEIQRIRDRKRLDNTR